MHIYFYVCIKAGNTTVITPYVNSFVDILISSEVFTIKAALNILRLTY